MGLNLRWLLCLLLSLSWVLLISCNNLTEEQLSQGPLLGSPYSMPASAYLALAKQRTGEERDALVLLAAGRLIQDGMWQQARNILTQLSVNTPVLLDEKTILLAKINRIQNNPREILSRLAQVKAVNALPGYYQAQFHELLASAYSALHHPTESINERVKLEAILTDNNLRANNRRALWLALTQLPNEELNTIHAEAGDDVLMRAWMELALIAREYASAPQQLLNALHQWRNRYPNHPGNTLLPASLEDIKPLLHNPPQHIALLLPLSGSLAGPGLAIKEGFLAAFNQNQHAPQAELRVYDTNRTAAEILYAQALQDGNEFIIGPLTREDVARVAHIPHPVPTVLLNEGPASLPNNTYQFGLSATLEAQQLAARARKNGLTRALVITPNSTWGNDVANSFSIQWQALGGQVTDTLHLAAQADINQAIYSFLRIDASEARAKQLRQLVGHSIESTPHRRQDFDVIILIAYPSMARQIKPLLNYYYAFDVPVYALSNVYSGTPNTTKDRDLNGIIFPDMPWIFTHQIGQKNWPESFNSYNRLYALGLDSFALTTQLNQLLLFPAIRTENGVLYLTANHHIARIPDFAQFKEGLPEIMTVD